MAISLAFFIAVMTGTILCGQWVLRRVAATNPDTVPDQTSGAILLDVFRSIGEQFPAAHKEENKYRVQLAQLGYRGPSAVAVFYGIKFTSALLTSALIGLALVLGNRETAAIAPVLCGAGFGFLFPDRLLKARIRTRKKRIRAGLPAALDLMMLGLEAGQSLDHTLEYASRALKNTHADLSWELGYAYLELRAGDGRAAAFRNLAERNAEPELRKVSTLLMDSDRFGTSLGPALRNHAKYLRIRYRQQAQEAARKVGVRMIFPIFIFIFPSVLLVTLAPACIMMYQELQSLMK